MNVCAIAGEIVEQPLLRGKETKALVFVVETRQPANNGDQKEQSTRVPAVMFNPDESLAEQLVKNGKGMLVIFQGRVQGTPFEVSGGGTRYNGEVVVYNRSFTTAKR